VKETLPKKRLCLEAGDGDFLIKYDVKRVSLGKNLSRHRVVEEPGHFRPNYDPTGHLPRYSFLLTRSGSVAIG
jgi:hypothetical protein